MNILIVLLIVLVSVLSILMLLAGLPGTYLLFFLLFLVSVLSGFHKIGLLALVSMLILVLLAELIEYIASAYEVNKRGASAYSSFASIFGGIAGAFILTPVFPGVATLIGAFLGSFIFAFSVELVIKKDIRKAAVSGYASFLGRVKSIFVKVLTVIIMAVVSIISILT